MNTTIDEIKECLKRGKGKRIKELIRFALEEGIDPRKIMEEGLLGGMEQVSARFKEEEVAIADILSTMRALNGGMDTIKESLNERVNHKRTTVILGTVKGDYHDIGKKMIEMMLVSQGLYVVDLGVDVPAYKFVDNAVSKQAQIVCCSGFLKTSERDMKKIVDEFKKRGIRDQFYIMIGGPFVNDEVAKRIGADCYTEDASECAKKIKEYCANQ